MNILDFQVGEIPTQAVSDPVLDEYGISLSVLRCDLIHPHISGNKWFKLKYNLLAAQQQGMQRLLSFGGAWSNHIHALAAAGKVFDFETVGVIRGELESELTACLKDAVTHGMQLHGVSREAYREKESAVFLRELHEELGEFFMIPEGGANLNGIKGCAEILHNQQASEFDVVCLACGTGTTLAGLITGTESTVLGFQVLKGENYLAEQVNQTIEQFSLVPTANWTINDAYHFGGYARSKPELLAFIKHFEAMTDIPLEPVYSGKMLFGIYDLLKQGYFPRNSKVLAIHGGGLQGQRGFSKPA